MTLITFQDSKPVMRDGQVGTGPECCCANNTNCCKEQNINLQITLEISGIADDQGQNCDCLNGTYVFDVQKNIAGTDYGNASQSVCEITDQNNDTLFGNIFLEWHCKGWYALADVGTSTLPNDWALLTRAEQYRTQFFSPGVGDCVGDSVGPAGPQQSYNLIGRNACDFSGLLMTLTIAPA